MVKKDSLGQKKFLTASILGKCPYLHGAGKTTNRLATNDSSLVFLTGGNLVNLVGVVDLFAW